MLLVFFYSIFQTGSHPPSFFLFYFSANLIFFPRPFQPPVPCGVWRVRTHLPRPQCLLPSSARPRPALRRSWLIPIPSYSRAPRPLHRLNKDGGLPSRPLQGASTGRPRPSGHASPQPSSLLRQAPQEAVLLRGLHGGKEKRQTERGKKPPPFSAVISISGPFYRKLLGNRAAAT